MVYTISQIACIEREWPPFMQWHWIWLTPSHIEYIALTTAVPFNTGHPSAVSRSRQLKAALQVFSHYKVPLTFRYSWKRLRKRRSKNLIKFPQVNIAFVLQYIHCFEKKNTYWLNESWETHRRIHGPQTYVRRPWLIVSINFGYSMHDCPSAWLLVSIVKNPDAPSKCWKEDRWLLITWFHSMC